MHLSRNYRSHSGVLDVARKCLEALEAHFKGSVGSLKPDAGLSDGAGSSRSPVTSLLWDMRNSAGLPPSAAGHKPPETLSVTYELPRFRRLPNFQAIDFLRQLLEHLDLHFW